MTGDTIRRVRSVRALHDLLDRIEAGREPKPDWIHLQGDCRLDRVPLGAREALVRRLHGGVLRGFRARNARPRGRSQRLAYWRSVARNGFHDFSEQGWRKCYDSPFLQSYDYVEPYLRGRGGPGGRGGLEALDPYQVYAAVLGTYEYGVEDFVRTERCADVGTVVEPMAGTAEFAYQGHFRHPEFRYVMFDLDRSARRHVLARPWLADTEKHYVVADVLDETIWKQVKSLTTRRSLCYIGKQSHQFFDAKQLHRLLGLAREHVDYLVLEVPQLSLPKDLDAVEELTRPEMEDAGFSVALVDEPGGHANPFTNLLSFRLELSDTTGPRTLFRYERWTLYQAPMLVTLANLLDLHVHYYHSEAEGFLPVSERADESDVYDNVVFLLFTRHA
jgi:hypothetical protein